MDGAWTTREQGEEEKWEMEFWVREEKAFKLDDTGLNYAIDYIGQSILPDLTRGAEASEMAGLILVFLIPQMVNLQE